jgi:hypothetical protein
MLKDRVIITDVLSLNGQEAGATPEKEPVLIEGFFSAVCRERGKLVPGTRREGKNIWTLAGREYLARLMSYSAYGIGSVADTPARNDRIRYLGMGTGTQPEVATVRKLTSPVAFDAGGGQYLGELAIPTYPFQVSSTNFGNAVRYIREYSELELSVSGTIILTEAGLFTDGSPAANPPFTPKTRSLLLTEAAAQVPVAYKSFEALKKTQSFVLQVAWEVRF